jgi:hypothetical protein
MLGSSQTKDNACISLICVGFFFFGGGGGELLELQNTELFCC